jgi:hypothetical protein
MFYIVTRYIINIEGSDTRSQERFDDLTQAKKRWHSIIASDIDKTTIAWEMVQIVREDGICVASEIMDNRPAPEPEE